MKIDTLNIENIRSYDDECIDFAEGTTLFYGDNGAGKSTILQSIFGGLYQTDILKQTDKNLTLDKIVRRGQDTGKIELCIDISGNKYTITWEISVTEDEDGNLNGRTATCTLESETLDNPISGVTDVRKKILELVGLDAESFVSSVYVQQGDISKLIQASQSERQELIDGLLGLDQIDAYIERMKIARRELKSQRASAKNLLEEKEREKSEKRAKADIQNEISELKTERQSKKTKIAEKKKDCEDAVDKLHEMRAEVEEYEDKVAQLEDVEKEYKNQQERYNTVVTEIKEKRGKKDAISEEKNVVQQFIDDKRDELDISTDASITDHIEQLRTKKNNLRSEITTLEEGKKSDIQRDITEIKDKISRTEQTIEEKQEEISNITKTIEEKQEEISNITKTIEELRREEEDHRETIEELGVKLDVDDPFNCDLSELTTSVFDNLKNIAVELGENQKEKSLREMETVTIQYDTEQPTISELTTTIENKQEAIANIAERKSNIDALKQEVAQLEDITEKIESKTDKITELEADIRLHKEEITELEADISELSITIEQEEQNIIDKNDQIESITKEIASIESDIENIEDKLTEYTELREKIETVEDIQSKIDTIESTIENKIELRKEIRSTKDDKERRFEQLTEDVSEKDIESTKNKIQQIESLKQKEETQIANLEDDVEKITEQIINLKHDVEQIEEITEQINRIENQVKNANARVNEATDVIESYENVKTNLREENIGLLNKYANEIFQSFYTSATYNRLEIDNEYNITLITTDNTRIEPELSSGGEGTVISLAIRAAVFKLLVERNQNKNSLPPFILDEPTTYLDSDHISNLQNVIDTITSWDVPQILIVSHNDELIQNSSIAYNIQKDPKTNTSQVSQTTID